MTNPFDVIVFDLGGVLVELGPSPLPRSLLPVDLEFKLADWFHSDTALAFEKGLISRHGFADRLIEELGLQCGREQVIDSFAAWPIGLYAGASELLAALRPRYRLAILTNTNELHWERIFDEFGLDNHVDWIFASHQLSMVKPDAAIFHHVIDSLDTAAEKILYFDDNPDNVRAAGACGLQAQQVHGIEQLSNALRSKRVFDHPD